MMYKKLHMSVMKQRCLFIIAPNILIEYLLVTKNDSRQIKIADGFGR